MPELPETEIISSQLNNELKGYSLIDFKEIKYPNFVISKSLLNTNKEIQIKDNIIEYSERIGKYITIKSTNLNIIIHLGMTGNIRIINNQFLEYNSHILLKKHDHLYCHMTDYKLKKTKSIIFNDVRKFGRVFLLDNKDFNEKITQIKLVNGIDIFKNINNKDTSFINDIFQLFKHSKKTIYEDLISSNIFTGCGNIYTNELLFSLKIHPLTLSKNINQETIITLYKKLYELFNFSISLGGSSIKDYTDIYNKKGTFPRHFKCYKQENTSCSNCGDIIIRNKYKGRSFFNCPSCQQIT